MLGSPLLIWGNKNLKNGHRLEEKPETEGAKRASSLSGSATNGLVKVTSKQMWLDLIAPGPQLNRKAHNPTLCWSAYGKS